MKCFQNFEASKILESIPMWIKRKEGKMSDYFSAGTLVRICYLLINLIIFLTT